jgi:hypothetical protein
MHETACLVHRTTNYARPEAIRRERTALPQTNVAAGPSSAVGLY